MSFIKKSNKKQKSELFMKNILITGANSYIGTSFENYIKENYPNDYHVDTIDMIDGLWREKSFFGYDAVFHVAGIVHQKETKNNQKLYFEVNRDLALAVAKKAKAENVGQFVFLSTMSVYGKDVGVITPDTLPMPITAYGRSKLEAENAIKDISSDNFKVCILRPPMVYGDGCKGNYQSIVGLVKHSWVFPKIRNERSLIHIDNLVEFVRMAIDKRLDGTFFPQNKKYVSTMDLAKDIAVSMNKKIYFSRLLGFFVWVFRPFVKKLKKAFGSLLYKDTEVFDFEYCNRD